MKARVVWKGSKQQNAAMNAEIERQLAERLRNHEDNVDALVMYVLYKKFGFGKRRLRQFYEGYQEELNNLIEYYEMPKSDTEYLAKAVLKDKGIDVESWNDETFGRDRGNKVDYQYK